MENYFFFFFFKEEGWGGVGPETRMSLEEFILFVRDVERSQ